MKINTKLLIILVIFLASILIIFSFDPISQPLEYHNFSDKRSWFGISNFADTMSNIPYIIVGILGVFITLKNQNVTKKFQNRIEIIPFIIVFVGIFLVGLGSGYYHLEPNNQTLVWDRLPMTIAFMSLFSIIIGERISIKLSLFLLPILLIIGIYSIYYWNFTENLGRGDLRIYAMVQFFPIIAIPVIILLYPKKYTKNFYIAEMIFWYLVAKIFEHFDHQVFELTNHIISGHTLKHLSSALATYALVKYVRYRNTKALTKDNSNT